MRVSPKLTWRKLVWEQYWKAKPKQLSGGQTTCGHCPCPLWLIQKLILFDESTSALDPENGRGKYSRLLCRSSETGLTMIIVPPMKWSSHVMLQTVSSSFLDKGVIVEQGSPEQLLKILEERTKEFSNVFNTKKLYFDPTL